MLQRICRQPGTGVCVGAKRHRRPGKKTSQGHAPLEHDHGTMWRLVQSNRGAVRGSKHISNRKESSEVRSISPQQFVTSTSTHFVSVFMAFTCTCAFSCFCKEEASVQNVKDLEQQASRAEMMRAGEQARREVRVCSSPYPSAQNILHVRVKAYARGMDSGKKLAFRLAPHFSFFPRLLSSCVFPKPVPLPPPLLPPPLINGKASCARSRHPAYRTHFVNSEEREPKSCRMSH